MGHRSDWGLYLVLKGNKGMGMNWNNYSAPTYPPLALLCFVLCPQRMKLVVMFSSHSSRY